VPDAALSASFRLISWRATSLPTTPRPAIAIFKTGFSYVIKISIKAGEKMRKNGYPPTAFSSELGMN
jgi:hypothetical protein